MYGRNRFSLGAGSSMTPMVQRIMIGCGVIWVLQWILLKNGVPITALGAVSVDGVFGHGFLWQPLTYMWMHSTDTPWHLIMNMFTLWMFGGQLEMTWGSRRFLRFYLSCGVGAGLIILGWHALLGVSDPFMRIIPTLGASGAVYGLLTAFSLLWPDRTIMLLFPPIPMRAIWFIPFLFAMELAMGGNNNVSTVGHLGGVIVAGVILRDEVKRVIGVRSLRYRWHRMRMRSKLRAVRRDEWERRQRDRDDDRPTFH